MPEEFLKNRATEGRRQKEDDKNRINAQTEAGKTTTDNQGIKTKSDLDDWVVLEWESIIRSIECRLILDWFSSDSLQFNQRSANIEQLFDCTTPYFLSLGGVSEFFLL